MSVVSCARLPAAFCIVLTASAASAESPIDFLASQGKAAVEPVSVGRTAGSRVVSGNVHRLQRGNAGALARQTPSVATGCLRSDLVGVLRRASAHFGSEVVVTSGFRRGRGFHARCMAADVQIAGVGSGVLARYFRGQAGVGGVGTYGHTRSVHVDVAERRYSWHGRSRRMRVADACPCCGGSAHAGGGAAGPRAPMVCERSVIGADVKLGGARS